MALREYGPAVLSRCAAAAGTDRRSAGPCGAGRHLARRAAPARCDGVRARHEAHRARASRWCSTGWRASRPEAAVRRLTPAAGTSAGSTAGVTGGRPATPSRRWRTNGFSAARSAGPRKRALDGARVARRERRALSDAFTTALAPQPSDRFATCAAFVSALRAAARPSSKRRSGGGSAFRSRRARVAPRCSRRRRVSDALIETRSVAAAACRRICRWMPVSQRFGRGRGDVGVWHQRSPVPVPVHPAARIVPHAPPAAATAADPDASVSMAREASPQREPRSSAHGFGGFSCASSPPCCSRDRASVWWAGYLLADSRRTNARAPRDRGCLRCGARHGDARNRDHRTRRCPPPRLRLRRPIPPACSGRARGASRARARRAARRAVRRSSHCARRATKDAARLLVRTTPPGASVTVDGIVRGKSPIALRDLELGTRTIVVARPGYVSAERRITLTADRPSRSVDVSLAPVTAARAGAAPAVRGGRGERLDRRFTPAGRRRHRRRRARGDHAVDVATGDAGIAYRADRAGRLSALEYDRRSESRGAARASRRRSSEEAKRNERDTGARRRHVVQGRVGGCARRDVRRSRLQHEHDRLSGSAHRPVGTPGRSSR